MAKKMSRRLVALSASAVAAVYLAGYITTQSADAHLAGTERAPMPAFTGSAPTPGGAPIASTTAQPSPVAASATTSAATIASTASTGYQDGTYQGNGTSRRGDVAVVATIQDGRIADVKFTRVTTQYPVSRIAALPGQVVARQSAQVDRISGATYSVQAFQQAVQQALAQAQSSGVASGTLPAQAPTSAGAAPAQSTTAAPAPAIAPAQAPAPSIGRAAPSQPAPAPAFPWRRDWDKDRDSEQGSSGS